MVNILQYEPQDASLRNRKLIRKNKTGSYLKLKL